MEVYINTPRIQNPLSGLFNLGERINSYLASPKGQEMAYKMGQVVRNIRDVFVQPIYDVITPAQMLDRLETKLADMRPGNFDIAPEKIGLDGLVNVRPNAWLYESLKKGIVNKRGHDALMQALGEYAANRKGGTLIVDRDTVYAISAGKDSGIKIEESDYNPNSLKIRKGTAVALATLGLAGMVFLSSCSSAFTPPTNVPASPTATATATATATSTPPTVYAQVDPLPSNTPTPVVVGPDYNSSSLIASFGNPEGAGGPVTSCDLISKFWNTPDINVAATILMLNGLPAGNISAAMVFSDKNGNVLYNDEGAFLVHATGQLFVQPIGITGATTHFAVFPGVKLTNANGDYIGPVYYQIRALNKDGTLDGQIGGLTANCMISKDFPNGIGPGGTKPGGDGLPPPTPGDIGIG